MHQPLEVYNSGLELELAGLPNQAFQQAVDALHTLIDGNKRFCQARRFSPACSPTCVFVAGPALAGHNPPAPLHTRRRYKSGARTTGRGAWRCGRSGRRGGRPALRSPAPPEMPNARGGPGKFTPPPPPQHPCSQLRESQRPLAVVICCSDSRCPPELIFDQVSPSPASPARLAGSAARSMLSRRALGK